MAFRGTDQRAPRGREGALASTGDRQERSGKLKGAIWVRIWLAY